MTFDELYKEYEHEQKLCKQFSNKNFGLSVEITKLKKENELLKEELTNLKNDITRVYNTMTSLETINKHEMEDIEEL